MKRKDRRAGNGDSPTVLIVENGDNERRGLESLLELEGFAVAAVPDAPAATALLEANRFDLVITDLSLPGEGLPGLLALSQHRAAPVIVISGDSRALVRHQILSRGASAFLRKPLLIRELLAEIERALEAS